MFMDGSSRSVKRELNISGELYCRWPLGENPQNLSEADSWIKEPLSWSWGIASVFTAVALCSLPDSVCLSRKWAYSCDSSARSHTKAVGKVNTFVYKQLFGGFLVCVYVCVVKTLA